jgi:hypothetical protein
MSRTVVLTLYRDLLATSKRIPEAPRRDKALRDIKESFRKNQTETKTVRRLNLSSLHFVLKTCSIFLTVKIQDVILEAIKKADSTLKYLRMITPHQVARKFVAVLKFRLLLTRVISLVMQEPLL